MRRTTRNGILLGIGSGLATLLLLELLLRAAGIAYPYFRQVDPVTGYALRPHAEGWSRDEGNAYVTINGFGMRNREVTVAKPPHTLRIAVLGDSFMEGVQVADDEVFAAVLERELGACMPDKRIEVLNFGVSGFGTAQQLLLLQDRVWKFEPDIILLSFFAGNDIRDNTQAMTNGTDVPFFTLQSGALALDNSFAETAFFRRQHSPLFWAMHAAVNRSRTLQVLNRARLLAREIGNAPVRGDATRALWKGPHFEDGVDANMLAPPKDTLWKEGWNITEALIAAMHADVAAHGARFLVMTVTHELQAYPDPSVRSLATRELGVRDLSYADRRIQALGTREGFPVVSLADVLQPVIASGTVLHGFPPKTAVGRGHWNNEGHRLAAQTAAKSLCSR